jgi:predicted HAD superfamily Cof-like phosphohydrolase
MTDNPGFHRAVVAEINRRARNDRDDAYYDRIGIDEILKETMDYISRGATTQAGASLVAARAYLQRHTKNPMQEAVEEFMTRADQEVAKYPKLPDHKVRNLRIRLMVEELLGSETPYEGYLKLEGIDLGIDLIKNKSDELVQSMLDANLVGVADGLADVLYVVFGTAAAYGIDIQEVFDEVHRSNLSKTVWSEELQRWTIEKDEFGKGIKPPTYSPANLEPIVLRQIENGKIIEGWKNDQSVEAELIVATIED